jgi:hypothetical protein
MFSVQGFDPLTYDNFAKRIGAFLFTDVMFRQTRESEKEAARLAAASKPLRKKLRKAAKYLWDTDARFKDVVKSVRGGVGYVVMADDMIRTSSLLLENWDEVKGQCTVTEKDLADAKDLGTRILAAMSDKGSTEVETWRELRNRAGVYLRDGLKRMRSAAVFAHQDDVAVAQRYPSLYSYRKKPSKPKPSKTNGNGVENLATAVTHALESASQADPARSSAASV